MRKLEISISQSLEIPQSCSVDWVHFTLRAKNDGNGVLGKSRIILGTASDTYYSRNGTSDFALITNFKPGSYGAPSPNVIQLRGLSTNETNASQAYGYRLENVGSDTEIRLDSGELIAKIQGVKGLSLLSNVFSFVGITPTTTPPDYAGNTPALAKTINGLTSNGTVFQSTNTDWVGPSDINDYYRFTLSDRFNFNLSLSGLSGDADLQLLDANGGIIQSSTQGNTTPESIVRPLDAGTYFVRVFPYSSYSTNYTLTTSGTRLAPPDGAGNDRGSARNIGALSGTNNFSDFVGNSDTNDFYKFTLSDYSNLRINLNGLSADADVQIQDKNGNSIWGSYNGGSSADTINRMLYPGEYFARVYQGISGANTNYNLELKTDKLIGSVTDQGLTISPTNGSNIDLTDRSFSSGVNIYRYDINGQRTYEGIEPGKDTILVIHGLNSSTEADNIRQVYQAAMQNNPNSQVLALDWRDPAGGSIPPLGAALRITPVANWAVNALKNLGIDGQKVTVIGHSLGAYVASEIGRSFGKVKKLVALDPAFNPVNPMAGYDLDGNQPGFQGRLNNLKDAATESLALVVQDARSIDIKAQLWSGGLAGDNDYAQTANRSFIVNFDDGIPLQNNIDYHGAVVKVYANWLSSNNRQLPGDLKDNWYNNVGLPIGGGHDGVIGAYSSNGAIQKLWYVNNALFGVPQQRTAWT
jgi:pimeloyl-ACP methyl ester carboxylesterase